MHISKHLNQYAAERSEVPNLVIVTQEWTQSGKKQLTNKKMTVISHVNNWMKHCHLSLPVQNGDHSVKNNKQSTEWQHIICAFLQGRVGIVVTSVWKEGAGDRKRLTGEH